MLTKEISRKALSLHRKLKGKIMAESKIRNLKPHDMQLIYTLGVAAVILVEKLWSRGMWIARMAGIGFIICAISGILENLSFYRNLL